MANIEFCLCKIQYFANRKVSDILGFQLIFFLVKIDRKFSHRLMQNPNNGISKQQKRKLLSLLAHASILFSSTLVSVIVPLILLLVVQDSVVIGNAKESLNLQLTFYIYGVCFIPLIFVVIGIPLLILLFIATLIMPIFALLKISRREDSVYRYPLIIHFI